MNDDKLEKLRKGIESHLDARAFHQTEETNPTITGIIQCYLLLQILDKLDVLIYRTEVIFHKIGENKEK